MRILALCGSLRAASYNRQLVQYATTLAPTSAHLVTYRDLRRIPPFSEDDEDHPPAAVHDLRAAIAAADAVLLATPEYNGSVPGQLKNALDWASRPFPDNVLRDKPAAVMGASPSPSGAARAAGEARVVLARAGAHVLDDAVQVPHAYQQLDPAGGMADAALSDQLTELLDALAGAVSPTAEGAAMAPVGAACPQ
ncbi:MAG: NADPH-dependent FMN reductase [Nocardioidaceae bacterium]